LNTALEEAETRAGAKAQEAFSRWAEAAEAEQTGRIEEAEKIASRRREALETEELQWQENAEGQFSRWKRDFDANVSIWRAETEAAWKELQGSTETEYQELTRAGEEASTRWREAEQRWKRAEEEIAGAVEEMRERLAKAERQSGESAAALRKNFGETAAELQAALNETAERLQSGLEGTDSRLRKALEETDTRLQKALEETTGSLQRTIAESSFDSGQKALEDADKRLEVYRAAQSQQFKNLESLADDTARLESELRQAMETAENRVREDFALFESASAQERADASNAFDEAAEDLRIKLAQIEREVEALKEKAYDNVSEKLNIFEEDFAGDLVKRGGAIQEKLDAWQEAQDRALAETGTGLEKRRAEMEFSLLDELKTRISEQRERTEADLERLKSEAEAYETGIRERMVQGDESLETYKNQMMGNLAEARAAADNQVKAEIGRFSLSMAENLKQARRDMEEWQEGITTEIKETDQAVEDLRRKSQELSADSDERLAAVRSSITGVNRQIQEFVDQTKLFEQAEKLKTELERRIEDLKGDMDGLDQRRSEAAELENQFTRIRRLEDEINAKMTRFLSEQRRIDLMEADFNRLLQTSQSVEEKLSEVSSSDDLLQGIQVQLRKINDALADTEEKYKRIEKKNLTLENINLGVDRNFKTLQETESSLKNLVEDLGSLRAEEGELRLALETLYEKNEQAQVTADKLTVLEQDLSTVEERIKTMQVAREWIAQAETRMQNLNREIQSQLKLMGEITRDDGDGPIRGSNPDSLITRENVHRLHRQGWVDDEIARTLKLSIGEVKLILEVPSQKGG
jgi:DNA repair exonuclease SbcCD ATPase subunit